MMKLMKMMIMMKRMKMNDIKIDPHLKTLGWQDYDQEKF